MILGNFWQESGRKDFKNSQNYYYFFFTEAGEGGRTVHLVQFYHLIDL